MQAGQFRLIRDVAAFGGALATLAALYLVLEMDIVVSLVVAIVVFVGLFFIMNPRSMQQIAESRLLSTKARSSGSMTGFRVKVSQLQNVAGRISSAGMRDRYQIELDIRREGSIEMVSFPASRYEGVDFVWPSNEIAEVIFSDRTDLGVDVSSETIFRSPIVMYSWQEVVDVMIAQEIVEQIDRTYFVVNTPALIEMVLSGTEWSAIGLPELGDRSVRVISTDPTQSNSGNMFYGLLLNLLADNEIAQQDDLETHLPTIIDYYERQGLMSDSSGSLFEDYLLGGVGANPIIVGYENQLIEVFLLNPELRDQLTTQTRVLYPRPTVWSSHPLLAISDEGERFMEALQDEDIQRIAWEDHGFRSDIPGITDPDTLDFEGRTFAKSDKDDELRSPCRNRNIFSMGECGTRCRIRVQPLKLEHCA